MEKSQRSSNRKMSAEAAETSRMQPSATPIVISFFHGPLNKRQMNSYSGSQALTHPEEMGFSECVSVYSTTFKNSGKNNAF